MASWKYLLILPMFGGSQLTTASLPPWTSMLRLKGGKLEICTLHTNLTYVWRLPDDISQLASLDLYVEGLNLKDGKLEIYTNLTYIWRLPADNGQLAALDLYVEVGGRIRGRRDTRRPCQKVS